MKKAIITILTMTCFGLMAQKATLSEGDKKFARNAAEDGMKEVKLGQLASTNGSSSTIRELGQMMVTDHTKAGDELKAWASKNGVTLPAEMSAEGKKDYESLSKKTGAEFDKEYAKCMVKDHKKAVADFKKCSEKCENAELKSWAAKTLPTLENHLKMSEDAWKMVDDKKDMKDKDKTAKKGSANK